jgi:hypothetical protein
MTATAILAEIGPGGGGTWSEDSAHSEAGPQSQFQVRTAGGHSAPRVSGLAHPAGRGTPEASSENLGHALQSGSSAHESRSGHPRATSAATGGQY